MTYTLLTEGMDADERAAFDSELETPVPADVRLAEREREREVADQAAVLNLFGQGG